MHDKVLDLFGPTKYTRWNFQNFDLKNALRNYLEYMFRKNTFNKNKVLSLAGNYLKFVREMYTVQL